MNIRLSSRDIRVRLSSKDEAEKLLKVNVLEERVLFQNSHLTLKLELTQTQGAGVQYEPRQLLILVPRDSLVQLLELPLKKDSGIYSEYKSEQGEHMKVSIEIDAFSNKKSPEQSARGF